MLVCALCTTLLESTISANKQVFAGGEMKAFNTLYNRILSEYESLNEGSLDKVGQAYLDIMNPIKGEFDYIVDKMPMNFTHIGFILKSLPSSSVFLMLRNPWDVAISLFKQRFVNNIPYASSFNIGVYIANFEASQIFGSIIKILKIKFIFLGMKTWSMILLTIKKKFTIFVGLNLLTRALLEKNILREQEACIKCRIKLIKTLLKKTLRDFIKNLWSLIYHRENTGLIMEFILKIHIFTLIKIFCCKIAT